MCPALLLTLFGDPYNFTCYNSRTKYNFLKNAIPWHKGFTVIGINSTNLLKCRSLFHGMPKSDFMAKPSPGGTSKCQSRAFQNLLPLLLCHVLALERVHLHRHQCSLNVIPLTLFCITMSFYWENSPSEGVTPRSWRINQNFSHQSKDNSKKRKEIHVIIIFCIITFVAKSYYILRYTFITFCGESYYILCQLLHFVE